MEHCTVASSLTRHDLVLQRQSSEALALLAASLSSTAKGGLAGNHPGAIHPNPICGITYETTSQDKLRSACKGFTYSVMCAKYHVPTRNVAMVIFRWSLKIMWRSFGHHG
jgi:hypothetical protein